MKILDIISRSHRERGYSPTYAEIAEEMQVSPVTIYEHIGALEKKGAIVRHKYQARSIEILDRGYDKSRRKEVVMLSDIVEAVQPLVRMVDEIEYDCLKQHGDRFLLEDDRVIMEKRGLCSVTIGDLRRIRELSRQYDEEQR
jgi:SOS-response transcriptional repressor LexA